MTVMALQLLFWAQIACASLVTNSPGVQNHVARLTEHIQGVELQSHGVEANIAASGNLSAITAQQRAVQEAGYWYLADSRFQHKASIDL
jgi:hypothetical protein